MHTLIQIAALGVLLAATHWLIARAEITQVFWGNVGTGFVGKLLACPACSGWWLGIGAYFIGLRPLDQLVAWPWAPLSVAAAGLLGLFLTPVFEAVLLWGLYASAISTDEPTA